MLIHLIQQRLSDVETFGDRYTPGGFANASKAARVMRELMFGKAEVIIKIRLLTFQVLIKLLMKEV